VIWQGHCSACGAACPGDMQCVSGSCVCPSVDQTNCGGGRCPNLQTSKVRHTLGSQRHDWAVSGWLSLAWHANPAILTMAQGRDLQGLMHEGNSIGGVTWQGNCGACGTACPGDLQCSNGECACPSGLTDCNSKCVDTSSNKVRHARSSI
jgi:hypothetical protein